MQFLKRVTFNHKTKNYPSYLVIKNQKTIGRLLKKAIEQQIEILIDRIITILNTPLILTEPPIIARRRSREMDI